MIYVALFKGINVGGNHIIKMVELKKVFEEQGLAKANSYIQSGNVVFETKREPAEFKEKLSVAFAERFGFQCPILIRSRLEIKAVIENLPFGGAELEAAKALDPEVEHLYVYFRDDPAVTEKLANLLTGYSGPDLAINGPGAIYVLCQGSIRLSALALKLNKTFPEMTARNWKTLNKISEMMFSEVSTDL